MHRERNIGLQGDQRGRYNRKNVPLIFTVRKLLNQQRTEAEENFRFQEAKDKTQKIAKLKEMLDKKRMFNI